MALCVAAVQVMQQASQAPRTMHAGWHAVHRHDWHCSVGMQDGAACMSPHQCTAPGRCGRQSCEVASGRCTCRRRCGHKAPACARLQAAPGKLRTRGGTEHRQGRCLGAAGCAVGSPDLRGDGQRAAVPAYAHGVHIEPEERSYSQEAAEGHMLPVCRSLDISLGS
jgi:hypothetical protein